MNRRALPLLLAVLLALAVHVLVGLWFLEQTWWAGAVPEPPPMRVSFVRIEPPEPEEPELLEEPPPPVGQVVDIARPEDPKEPEEADFLAEYDSSVEEQTVDPRTRVERLVTAPTFSPDDVLEQQAAVEMDQPLPSTGATAGREVFRKGEFSLFPDRKSYWDRTNRPGLDLPVPSSHSASRLAGAPSNDYLPEIERSDRTRLNTREFLFADYINEVGNLISFFMKQTLRNARSSVPLVRSEYTVGYLLHIAPDGAVASLAITSESGVPEFDEALREAVGLAAPFPDPPTQGLGPSGAFELPAAFVVGVGRAQADFSGVDPRAGVQFPGLSTVPR